MKKFMYVLLIIIITASWAYAIRHAAKHHSPVKRYNPSKHL